MDNNAFVMGVTAAILPELDEMKKEISEITPEKYVEYSPVRKLTIQMAAAILAEADNDFDIFKDFFDIVHTDEVVYQYRYIDENSNEYLFATSAELRNHFGLSPQTVWRKYRSGDIKGQLSKINEIHTVTRDGKTLKVQERKVFYNPVPKHRNKDDKLA